MSQHTSNPDPEDQPFHHYSTKHRIVAWVSQNMFGNTVYTCRHGLMKGLKRKGGLGWLPEYITRGEETPEHRFWVSLDVRGKVVYDVGSFHGLIALFLAQTARRVVCFEPNDENRKRLQENLALNGAGNVTVRPVGVGAEPSTATMVYTPLMTGGASTDSRTVEQLLQKPGSVRQEITITTLDAEVDGGLEPPDFIKIDIEGLELSALQGARRTLERYRPELFLEMHGETIREKKAKVLGISEFLTGAGYRIRHVETGADIRPENSAVAMEGHLYAVPLAARA